MDKKQPKIIRFLESIGLEDVTRFGMDFELVACDAKNKSLVHMTIRKETPWDYALLTEFLDALQNASFNMDIRFVYAEEPGRKTFPNSSPISVSRNIGSCPISA